MPDSPESVPRPSAAGEHRPDEHDSSCLPVGERLGEFEITGLVGVGGFGIVYSAHDHLLQREVAIKEYMPSALASRTADLQVAVKSDRHQETFSIGLRSFVNEARLLAQFDHPSLVKVYRFWEANGTAYMVMPFYKGSTLRAALKALGEAPAENLVLQMLRPLLDALDVIHAANCYHRDIAPDNILILQSGQPVLLDFGAARRVIGDFTQALTVILKPGFAPVEQYANGPEMRQGPWTDIYALAAVIYYCISGKTPTPAVSRMMRDTLVPARELGRGRYSERFLAAIDRGLAVRIEDRTASVSELRADLGLVETVEASPLTMLGGGPQTGQRASPEPERPEPEDVDTTVQLEITAQRAARAPTTPTASAPASATAADLAAIAGASPTSTSAAAANPSAATAVTGPAPAVAPPASAVSAAPPANGATSVPEPTVGSPGKGGPSRTVLAVIAGIALVAGVAGWLVLGKPPVPAAVQSGPSPGGAGMPTLASGDPGTPSTSADVPRKPEFSPLAVVDALFSQRDPQWTLSVKLRSETLKINDHSDLLQFRVLSARPGYLYVWQVGSNGVDFWQLFPNPINRNNRIEANREMSLPGSQAPVYASGPVGISRLIAFVTPSPRDFKATGLSAPKDGSSFDEFDLPLAKALWSQEGPAAFAGKPVKCTLGSAECARFGAAQFAIREVE